MQKKITKIIIRNFSISLSVLHPNKRPKLTLETKSASTGNQGLDKEKEWRDKSAMCEHEKLGVYVAGSDDERSPMLCDMPGDGADEYGKTTQEKELRPNKHPAVTHKGDKTHICEECFIVICDKCREDYPDSEYNTPTPSQIEFPQYSHSENNKQINTKPSPSEAESKDETVSVSKESPNEKSNKSNIDDFADPSTEMPDYID